MKRLRGYVLLLSVAMILSGCEGGDGGDESDTKEPPAGPTVSTISGSVAPISDMQLMGAMALTEAITVTAVNSEMQTISAQTAPNGGFILTIPSGESYVILFMNPTNQLIGVLIQNGLPTALTIQTLPIEIGTIVIAGGKATSANEQGWSNCGTDPSNIVPDYNHDGTIALDDISTLVDELAEAADPSTLTPAGWFPVEISMSGAVSGMFKGTGQLTGGWVWVWISASDANNSGFELRYGLVLRLATRPEWSTKLDSQFLISDQEPFEPSVGTYGSTNNCYGTGSVTENGRQWEWTVSEPAYGSYTLVLYSISVENPTPQASVYAPHGTLDATAVPICINPKGKKYVCDQGGPNAVGSVYLHASF